MQCSSCGATVPNGNSFCSSCGRRLPPPLPGSCPNCGQPLRPGLKFCTSCGASAVWEGHAEAQPQSPTFSPIYQPPTTFGTPVPTHEEPKKKGSPYRFWLPFLLLLSISVAFAWLGNSGLVGWVILLALFALTFFSRKRLQRGNVAVSGLTWLCVTVVVLFSVALSSPPSTDSIASGGKASPTPVGAKPGATTGAATSAGAQSTAGPVNTSGNAAPTKLPAASPTARPTPTRLKLPVPDALKPLVFTGAKPANQINYEAMLDGDRGYASLFYDLRGETVDLPNLTGDSSFQLRVYFYQDPEPAKAHMNSQLETVREGQKSGDKTNGFNGLAESSLGKGDEGFLFAKSNADQPRYVYRWYAVRQGPTWFLISTNEDGQRPVVPGDGIDAILETVKKLDNKALIAEAAKAGGAQSTQAQPTPAPATQPTQVKPTQPPAPASNAGQSQSTAPAPKAQNPTVGIGLDQIQKVQQPTNSLKSDTEEISLSLEFVDVPGDTAVGITLFYLPTNDSVDGPVQKLSASQGISRIGFAFSRPDKGWPVGQYRAVFTANGQIAARVEFSVQ
jgi:hypothetical protein